jgi:hypothetical protein
MTEEVKSASETKKEDWMNSKWRPMMGWMYMLVCMFDMILFPVLWSLLQTVTHTPITQWNPLTLQGAGLFHIAMGAVLGIAAFGRTQEKLNGANNGGAQLPSSGFTAPSAPQAGFGAATGSFGAPASTAVSPAPSWGTTPVATSASSGFGITGAGGGFGQAAPAVVTGFGGKPAPVQPEQPAI